MRKKVATTEPLMRAFCQVVQQRRESMGISQEELAHRAGLHRTYISDIERGTRNLSLKSLIRLSTALEIPMSELFSVAEERAASNGHE